MWGFPGGPNGKESAYKAGDLGFLGQEDSLEKGGHSLQYSCLENSVDRGAWQTTVHVVAKSCELLIWIISMKVIADFFKYRLL